MKKYLKDLEAELKKLKISDGEIAEILADHKEMLEEAEAEGISDEEMALKFGDPKKLAKELHEDVLEEKFTKKAEPVFGTESLQGYELVTSIQVLDGLNKVNINLVSEDIVYFPYEGESIEVYVRGKYREEEYSIKFNDGLFSLSKKKRVGINIFGKKAPDFGIKVPVCHLEEFKLNLISGDAELENINADNMELKTVSGDIEANNLSSSATIAVTVVSGDAELKGVIGNKLELSTVSGDAELSQVKLDESGFMSTVSGDVDAKDVKVPAIEFRTVSGDFEGSEVYCDIVAFKSVSGDFEINNSNKEHEIQIKSKSSLSGHVTIN